MSYVDGVWCDDDRRSGRQPRGRQPRAAGSRQIDQTISRQSGGGGDGTGNAEGVDVCVERRRGGEGKEAERQRRRRGGEVCGRVWVWVGGRVRLSVKKVSEHPDGRAVVPL